MPSKFRKKKAEKLEQSQKPEPIEVADTIAPPDVDDPCLHQNKHYTKSELLCTRSKGHEGNHAAELNGKQTEWSDAAGTPARKHA